MKIIGYHKVEGNLATPLLGDMDGFKTAALPDCFWRHGLVTCRHGGLDVGQDRCSDLA